MLFHPKELGLVREIVQLSMTSTLKRVTFGRAPDGAGGFTETPSYSLPVACRLAPISGTERLVADRVSSRDRCRLFAPHGFDAAAKDRVWVDGWTYEVDSVERRPADQVERSFLVVLDDSIPYAPDKGRFIIASAVNLSVDGDGEGDVVSVAAQRLSDGLVSDLTYEFVTAGSAAQAGRVAIEVAANMPIALGESVEADIHLRQGPSTEEYAVDVHSDAFGEPTTVTVTVRPGWGWQDAGLLTTGDPRVTVAIP